MIKLKPCPFCGVDVFTKEMVTELFKIVGNHKEECPFCLMHWGTGYENEESAIAAWNTRAFHETENNGEINTDIKYRIIDCIVERYENSFRDDLNEISRGVLTAVCAVLRTPEKPTEFKGGD